VGATKPELRERVDELFREPPEGFTAARNALVRELRSEGDRDAGDEVKALRRPSVAAWLVNRVSLDDPDAIAQFTAASEGLQAAQRRVVEEGEGADELRTAAAAEREKLSQLVDAARAIARELDRKESRAVFEQVQSSLKAAATDPDVLELVREGRLDKPREPSALVALGTKAAKVKPAKRRSPKRTADSDQAERRGLEAELEQARKRELSAEGRVEKAEASVKQAKAELRDRRADVRRLERDLERL
jgi:hypothetical protein